MRRGDALPELLAPAGDMECLVAAVRAGADAVYVGGKLYSARAYAKNFDIEELTRAVAYCHLHGVRLYVTLNTLLYDTEIAPAVDFARELYRIGVDALIIADLGLIKLLREVLPDLELHGSTQMSVHNSLGADTAASLGVSRIVLARELSGENIRRVTETCSIECEVFLHGALCVSHSGQCLFSSMVGGRSGNRGECAQPCRLPYCGDKYPLSLRDMSLAHHINELIDSGVASLKIEGRMKSADYVYIVTSTYRRLLDQHRSSNRREDEALARIFSRGGFTDGYFRGLLENGMTGIRSEADKEASRGSELGTYTPDRISVRAEVELCLDKPSKMTIMPKDESLSQGAVTVYGDVPDVARNAPLSRETVLTRLAKMGNTYLSLDPLDIDLHLDDGINLSPGAINALRRSAALAYEVRERAVSDYTLPPVSSFPPKNGYKRTAMVYNVDALNRSRRATDYFDKIFIPLCMLNECVIPSVGVALPPVIMEDEIAIVSDMLASAKARGVTDVLVGNLGHIPLSKQYGFNISLDFRLNVCNSYACELLYNLCEAIPMLSPELNMRDAEAIDGREIIYGRIPLMLTERCFIKGNFGCKNCGKTALTDRRGYSFPIMREWQHRNVIFNSAVTYIGDSKRDVKRFNYTHFIFSLESEKEMDDVISAYENSLSLPLDAPMRRIGKREAKKP